MANLAVSSKKVVINTAKDAVQHTRSFTSRVTPRCSELAGQNLGCISTATNSSVNGNIAIVCDSFRQQWNKFKGFWTKKFKTTVPSKEVTKGECNIIKPSNDNVNAILKDTIGEKPYRIATSGYSFETEGYEEITKEFLRTMDKGLGCKNTAYIYPPTLEKGSIYDITAQISGLSKDKALFATAEKYYSNFKLEQLSENADKKKYIKIPTLVFPTSEMYTSATANASNVLVCTGGRKVAVTEIAEALKRKHKVVLLHNLNLKNGTFNTSMNQVENAARFFDELRLSNALKYSESEKQELKALLEQSDVINEYVRVFLVNDTKSAAEAGKRAADFIRNAKSSVTTTSLLPSTEELQTMNLAQLREVAKSPEGLTLMREAGVISKKIEQKLTQSVYGQVKHKRIKTSDEQIVLSSLMVPGIDGKSINVLRGIPQDVLQSPVSNHIHSINWSTINPEVGVVVTQNSSKPVIARKIVTEGTLENSLCVNNSRNIPIRYDMVTGTPYIETLSKRQALTDNGFMVVYSSPVKRKSSEASVKSTVQEASLKGNSTRIQQMLEDRSFVSADIADMQYEIVTKSGERFPCCYADMKAGIDYKISKKAGVELKMAVPPTEVISSEGEILAPHRLYMVDSKGHFYNGNPIRRIKTGEINWQADMNDPVQAQIRNSIEESLRLETLARRAKKDGKDNLSRKLLQQAKNATLKAEKEMTEWVKTKQNTSNVEFFK